MGKILSIDYGLKRIGLAISDIQQRIAFPLSNLEGGEKAIQNILKFLLSRDETVELFLIGLPLLMNGTKGDMAKLVEVFAEKLFEATKIPYLLIDERLSSKQADLSLKDLSLSRKKRAKQVDSISAMLILQSYLDGKNDPRRKNPS